MNEILNGEYSKLVADVKQRVHIGRHSATRIINQELITLYHYIGKVIIDAQKRYSWGDKVIERLSADLRCAFPEMKGFSSRNLKNMRKLAQEYDEIGQQAVAQLPWGHVLVLIYGIASHDERQFYINHALEYCWSRSVLSMHIESNLYERQGKAITNFGARLPLPDSDLAGQALKDPYIFDFLSIGREAHEREIEKALVTHMEKFLLELGQGFAFVGRQYHLSIGEKDFYIDLLFYHLKLRCYFIVELKADDFKPEYAGKMNFYLSAVDDLCRHEDDNPSIGLILCRGKNNIMAEYALRDMSKPIGLAEYRFAEAIPDEIKTELPTIEEIEREFGNDSGNVE